MGESRQMIRVPGAPPISISFRPRPNRAAQPSSDNNAQQVRRLFLCEHWKTVCQCSACYKLVHNASVPELVAVSFKSVFACTTVRTWLAHGSCIWEHAARLSYSQSDVFHASPVPCVDADSDSNMYCFLQHNCNISDIGNCLYMRTPVCGMLSLSLLCLPNVCPHVFAGLSQSASRQWHPCQSDTHHPDPRFYVGLRSPVSSNLSWPKRLNYSCSFTCIFYCTSCCCCHTCCHHCRYRPSSLITDTKQHSSQQLSKHSVW